MKNRFSIITVCRNSARTISRTIDSVLSQSCKDFEYIIIDGGSSDGTQDVVRSYRAKVDIFVSEPDHGIADGFNKGISHASGEIIGFINSDDALLPGTLEKVNNFFIRNSRVEVMHADILLYDGDTFVKRIKPTGRWWYPWRLVLFNHPATFVKRSVYEKHGVFNIEFRYAMDDDLFLTWLKKGVNISYFPEPLVRMQAGGVSGKFAYQVFAEKRRSLIAHGFSIPLSNIQYIGRFGIQMIALLQTWLRRLRLNFRVDGQV